MAENEETEAGSNASFGFILDPSFESLTRTLVDLPMFPSS